MLGCPSPGAPLPASVTTLEGDGQDEAAVSPCAGLENAVAGQLVPALRPGEAQYELAGHTDGDSTFAAQKNPAGTAN